MRIRDFLGKSNDPKITLGTWFFVKGEPQARLAVVTTGTRKEAARNHRKVKENWVRLLVDLHGIVAVPLWSGEIKDHWNSHHVLPYKDPDPVVVEDHSYLFAWDTRDFEEPEGDRFSESQRPH